MTRWLLVAAFASLTPMLFMSMHVDVYPIPKLVCKIASAILLVAAIVSYGVDRIRRARDAKRA